MSIPVWAEILAEREQLERQRDEAVECLRDALAFIERYEDVKDGDDGRQVPNAAMHIGNDIRFLLSKYPKP